MTIRFACASQSNPIAGMVIRGPRATPYALAAANDNGNIAANDEALLTDTLRHFGSHGLCAAEVAAKSARSARETGDEAGFANWLAVCRLLDRRLAAAFEREIALGNPGSSVGEPA